jgi:hypothetical protein
MIKKFIYIGLVMILVAVILAVLSGYLLTNSTGKQVVASNITVNASSFADLPIQLHNSTALAIYVVEANATNIYILNSAQFSEWSSYMDSHGNASGVGYVETLGVNSTYIFKNKSDVYTEVLQTSASAPVSTEYVVTDNTQGSPSSNIKVAGAVTYIPLQISSLILYEIPVIIGLVLGIAGIIVVIYGFMKKRPEPIMPSTMKGDTKDEKEKQYVDQLYKGVGKGKRKKKAANQT